MLMIDACSKKKVDCTVFNSLRVEGLLLALDMVFANRNHKNNYGYTT